MMLDTLMKHREVFTHYTANYHHGVFAEELEKIITAYKVEQGTKTQAIGDEVHVEGL